MALNRFWKWCPRVGAALGFAAVLFLSSAGLLRKQDVGMTAAGKICVLVCVAIGVLLFAEAVHIELKNQPQNYSLKRSKQKYILQWTSFMFCFLGGAVYCLIKGDTNILALCIGGVVWMGLKALGTAVTPEPDIKPNSKAMKQQRKSLRR